MKNTRPCFVSHLSRVWVVNENFLRMMRFQTEVLDFSVGALIEVEQTPANPWARKLLLNRIQ